MEDGKVEECVHVSRLFKHASSLSWYLGDFSFSSIISGPRLIWHFADVIVEIMLIISVTLSSLL